MSSSKNGIAEDISVAILSQSRQITEAAFDTSKLLRIKYKKKQEGEIKNHTESSESRAVLSASDASDFQKFN